MKGGRNMETKLHNFYDFRAYARKKLPRLLFEYIDRGTEDEIALTELRQSLDSVRFVPEVLSGLETVQTDFMFAEKTHALPLVIAPTALAGLVSFDGEVKLARAAERARIPFTISTQSVTPVEHIRAGVPDADLWFQLYVWKNRALTDQLLDRVWASGVTTLVITADTPVSPNREYNLKNGFSIPFRPSIRAGLDVATHPRWFFRVLLPYLRSGGMPSYGHYPQDFRHNVTSSVQSQDLQLENLLNWNDVAELRKKWRGEIIVKGILSVNDAQKARAIGADGIVVSAHGGRNLDIAVTPLDVLGQVVEALNNRLAVFVDSGVRRGSDVLKLLSYGAKAVFIGRAPLWGLAAADEQGADAMIAILAMELQKAMTMLGRVSINDLKNVTRFVSR